MTWNHIIWFVIGISTTLGIINLCGYHIPWLVVFSPVIALGLFCLSFYSIGLAIQKYADRTRGKVRRTPMKRKWLA